MQIAETFLTIRWKKTDTSNLISCLNLCYKTSQLMLYREVISVCSQIHTKHINTVCGQNVELLNVELVVHIVTTAL